MADDDIDLSGTRVDPGRSPAKPQRPAGDSGGRRYVPLILGVVALGFVIAWVTRNRQTVRVDWLFGSTDAALALVIFVAAALGWAVGLGTAAVVRRRRNRRSD